MRAAILLAAAAAFALPAFAAPVRHRAHPVRHAGPAAAHDWSRTVVATPDGGFRMGNPAARAKVVEYGSLTCPHCAAFSRTGEQPFIQAYVKSGRASYEYRNFVLNNVDVVASLLARCAGPGFFRVADSFYSTQDQWLQKAGRMTQAQRAEVNALPVGQRLGRVADMLGLTDIAAHAGLPAARGKQCLADKGGVTRLGQIYQAGEKLGVDGTPTFFINGAKADVNTWPALEPLIRTAAGG
ncbi:MAG TPA: thioredoxin domain-containing protein [Allosphingosinicella sp.]|nr:thioredoxin domain-containing protein [Allosphingosinicella sp.]